MQKDKKNFVENLRMMISMAHDLLYQICFEKKVNKIKSINMRFLIYRFLICFILHHERNSSFLYGFEK